MIAEDTLGELSGKPLRTVSVWMRLPGGYRMSQTFWRKYYTVVCEGWTRRIYLIVMNRKALAGLLKSFPSPHCYENYLLCKELKECSQNPEYRLQGGAKVFLSTEARLHGAWLRFQGPRQTTGSSKGWLLHEGRGAGNWNTTVNQKGNKPQQDLSQPFRTLLSQQLVSRPGRRSIG